MVEPAMLPDVERVVPSSNATSNLTDDTNGAGNG